MYKLVISNTPSPPSPRSFTQSSTFTLHTPNNSAAPQKINSLEKSHTRIQRSSHAWDITLFTTQIVSLRNSDTALGWFKKAPQKLRHSPTFNYTVQFLYNLVGATHLLPRVNSAQKSQHTPHILSYETPTSTPAKDSNSHT